MAKNTARDQGNPDWAPLAPRLCLDEQTGALCQRPDGHDGPCDSTAPAAHPVHHHLPAYPCTCDVEFNVGGSHSIVYCEMHAQSPSQLRCTRALLGETTAALKDTRAHLARCVEALNHSGAVLWDLTRNMGPSEDRALQAIIEDAECVLIETRAALAAVKGE